MLTKPTKQNQITRMWYLVDCKNQVLGHIAVTVAHKLMGKSKPYFVRNLDCGDYVVAINTKYITVSGRKEREKLYSNYSGYPAGLKQKPLWLIRKENPGFVLRHAVYGMLPKNKLRDRFITRFYAYPDADHPFKDKINK